MLTDWAKILSNKCKIFALNVRQVVKVLSIAAAEIRKESNHIYPTSFDIHVPREFGNTVH